MPLNVVIIGGGIGGLCLAQGLRNAGVGVTVYEKGQKRDDPHWLQGYQIHVNPSGAQALQQCLPPSLWANLVDNACIPSAAFQVLTQQMDAIAVIEPELMNGSSHIPIVRTTLRRVLLQGLDDVVQFGKELIRYERKDSYITAFFADGTTAKGDILVGADGTGSNVRKQYLPHAAVVDTRMVGAASRLPITEKVRSQLPGELLTRLTSVVPAKSGYMIVTQSIYKPTANLAPDDIGDHLIWVFVSSRDIYGDVTPKMMDGRSIQSLVLQRIANWHPVFRRIVTESDPRQVAAVPGLTSMPIGSWTPSNITLLGDAIHTMTPLLGLGGSTALKDAGLLCGKLIEVDHGQATLSDAVRDYEVAMRKYAFRAVAWSADFGKLVTSDSWLLRAGFKTALRLLTRIPALKRRVFGLRRLDRN